MTGKKVPLWGLNIPPNTTIPSRDFATIAAEKAFLHLVEQSPDGRKDIDAVKDIIASAWEELGKYKTLETMIARAGQMKETVAEDSMQKLTVEATRIPRYTEAQKQLFADAIDTHVNAVLDRLGRSDMQEKRTL